MDLSRLAPIFSISVYLQNKLLADAKSNRALFMVVSKLFGLLRFHLNSLRDLKLGIATALVMPLSVISCEILRLSGLNCIDISIED